MLFNVLVDQPLMNAVVDFFGHNLYSQRAALTVVG
jgi:hypothetical protein